MDTPSSVYRSLCSPLDRGLDGLNSPQNGDRLRVNPQAAEKQKNQG